MLQWMFRWRAHACHPFSIRVCWCCWLVLTAQQIALLKWWTIKAVNRKERRKKKHNNNRNKLVVYKNCKRNEAWDLKDLEFKLIILLDLMDENNGTNWILERRKGKNVLFMKWMFWYSIIWKMNFNVDTIIIAACE